MCVCIAIQEDGIQIRKVDSNILNEQSRAGCKGDPPGYGMGERLRNSHHKRYCYEILHRASEWAGSC